ncbi:MAG: DNA repair protein RadA [Alphaproteobacteria bacterium]|nr:DNA repair protein RadA [Alphaproteobacteria bacterium]
MAKALTHFICQSCGASFPKWSGKCEACSAWNTLVQENLQQGPPKGLSDSKGKKGQPLAFMSLRGAQKNMPRLLSSIGECDRTWGGGLVPGTVTLVAGDPGIGKSTLLLQLVCALAKDVPVAYISGEEAIEQIRMRAQRLLVDDVTCALAAATSVRDIVASIDHSEAPSVLIIDSIQTMYVDTVDSAPGTVTQVRSSAQELIRIAKKRNIALILVGHVTKEGTIAGPRVLEHMVDTVLYLEGERGHQFRILRAVKNRFGPTNEIGVFEMQDRGLIEVKNPSALFLADRQGDMSGACVFAGLEGTRPVLVEIQALVAPSAYGTPRRAVIGWDAGRLAMVLAVLEARCGVVFGAHDVYLNVAGGLRITEPAADLAVAAALLSSLTGTPVAADAVVFGEIGLSGEVRQVTQPALRLKEAAKLGFARAILPRMEMMKYQGDSGIKKHEIIRLSDLLPLFQEGMKAPAPRKIKNL